MPPTMRQKGRVQQKQKTVQYRRFRGINLTDARTAIDDEDLAWLENAVTIGNGSIQIVPGPAAAVATLSGAASIWGGTINGNPHMLVTLSDGSIIDVTPGGVTTNVAPAGTVSTSAHVTTWQGSRFLIVDPTFGYMTWDLTTFSVIDASQKGQAIAVFEGRVWIANGRTITYTAPSTYNDFTTGNGSGSTLITDEAFDGNVVSLVSALEQLWVLGNSAIDAISNVQATGSAPSVVTTFSITNIVSNLGSNTSQSAIGYLRALAFLAPYGVYALSGVTPQKLSDKLDGLFPSLTFTTAPAAVAVIQSLPVLMFLVTYTGNNSRFNDATVNPTGVFPIPMLLCFTQGKWFLGSQGLHLGWITTVVVNGVAQVWGIDTSTGDVYQPFGAATTTAVQYKVQTKQFDFGSATQNKALMKVGLELQASADVTPSMTVDSELGSVSVTVTTTNALTLQNVPVALPTAQKVVNGTFDTNLNGWTVLLGSVVWSAGAALFSASRVGGITFPASLVQAFSILQARNYTLSMDIVIPAGMAAIGGTVTVTVIGTVTGTVYLNQTIAVDGTTNISLPIASVDVFTETGITIQVTANAPSTNNTSYAMTLDNVSWLDTVQTLSNLQILNNSNAPLNLIGQGLVLSRQDAQLAGRYLGLSVYGNDPPYRIQAFQMEVIPGREWMA